MWRKLSASLVHRADARAWVSRRLRLRSIVPVAVVLGTMALAETAVSAFDLPDTYTATTTDMTPAGVTLKVQVKEWSDDSARAAVLAVLRDAVDVQQRLVELPTVGYVWPSGSAVGYALKYAYREATADGGERITVVTDRPVGAYAFKPWAVNDTAPEEPEEYSVIELHLDAQGSGVGTMSLAAEVVLDPDAQTVSLDSADTVPSILTGATREPKPYWAQDN